MEYRKPVKGNALAVAAPAGVVDQDRLAAGLEILTSLLPDADLRVDNQVFLSHGLFAGDDQARAGHLAQLMTDPQVSAVLTARGGYGASRILPLLDLPRLAGSETLLIGFSDICCLLNALAEQGLVTVHGPVICQLSRLDEQSLSDFASLLRGESVWPLEFSGRGLVPGEAEGPLLGGNLTMLCHLLGTPNFPSLEGAVLFLEETGEAPYRLDRMLTQLELAGVLEVVAGVAMGWLSGPEASPPELEEVVIRRLQNLPCPVVLGLPFGHGPVNRIMPVGARSVIDGTAGQLTVGVELD